MNPSLYELEQRFNLTQADPTASETGRFTYLGQGLTCATHI